jgi:hypothetical protein
MLAESPVRYVEVPRGKWLTERDLLAHTRKGQQRVQRSELKLKEPSRLPPRDLRTGLSNFCGQHPYG